MSLTYNALARSPAYIFPATSADQDAAQNNSGLIPQGALMMLPPNFDSSAIENPLLRKVAETLKVYGAYVVDRNHGTPFAIYVEQGANVDLHRSGWDSEVGRDLDGIRAALRWVTSVRARIDGNGLPFTPDDNFNLISMRGPWRLLEGSRQGQFDSAMQVVSFPATNERIVQINESGRGLSRVSWAEPRPGTRYRLSVQATGGAKFRLQLRDKSGKIAIDSQELGDKQSIDFVWPESEVHPLFYSISGVGEPTSVKGLMKRF
jgi:hypothetical protein